MVRRAFLTWSEFFPVGHRPDRRAQDILCTPDAPHRKAPSQVGQDLGRKCTGSTLSTLLAWRSRSNTEPLSQSLQDIEQIIGWCYHA